MEQSVEHIVEGMKEVFHKMRYPLIDIRVTFTSYIFWSHKGMSLCGYKARRQTGNKSRKQVIMPNYTDQEILKKIKDYREEVTSSEAAAREFLCSLGTHNLDGTLTEEYRTD